MALPLHPLEGGPNPPNIPLQPPNPYVNYDVNSNANPLHPLQGDANPPPLNLQNMLIPQANYNVNHNN